MLSMLQLAHPLDTSKATVPAFRNVLFKELHADTNYWERSHEFFELLALPRAPCLFKGVGGAGVGESQTIPQGNLSIQALQQQLHKAVKAKEEQQEGECFQKSQLATRPHIQMGGAPHNKPCFLGEWLPEQTR